MVLKKRMRDLAREQGSIEADGTGRVGPARLSILHAFRSTYSLAQVKQVVDYASEGEAQADEGL